MPPRRNSQSVFANQLIAKYLARLMLEKTMSGSKIGKLVEVSASRVAKWFSGERGMMPSMAFELGKGFRNHG